MDRPTLVIAGASGFIGRWFIERYHDRYRIIALSRSAMEPTPGYEMAEWRQVDLFSITSTERAIAGADLALYLIHSMSPSARLHQGSFEDTDLILADNFARAARTQGLRQIAFVGGLLPDDTEQAGLSRHLRSRREVEITLGSTGVPVTTLRAGIIVGAGGSSFIMIERLVRRLPALISPAWCQTETHPIELDDMLRILDYCLGNPATYGEAIDVGGSDTTTYMEMMGTVADLLGKRRLIYPVRYFSPGLSTYWVSVFTETPAALVTPLVESLRHRMVAHDNPVLARFPNRLDFREAARRALFGRDRLSSMPRRLPPDDHRRNTVRSLQRLPNPEGHTATYVARLYQRWLPAFFHTWIQAVTREDETIFQFAGIPLLRLRFIPSRSDQRRQLFYIVGGVLADDGGKGWLEFRSVLDGRYIISAIHDFVPALPWYLYLLTQAKVHHWVMRSFGEYLAERGRQSA